MFRTAKSSGNKDKDYMYSAVHRSLEWVGTPVARWCSNTIVHRDHPTVFPPPL